MTSRRAWFRNLLAAPVGVYAVMKGIAAPKNPHGLAAKSYSQLDNPLLTYVEIWRKDHEGIVWCEKRFGNGAFYKQRTAYTEIPFVRMNPLEVPWSWHRSS